MTRLIRFFYEKLQAIACRISDRTILQNEEDADYLVSAGILPADRALIISGSGVPTATYSLRRVSDTQIRSARLELGFAPHAIVVTMVGRVIRTKGVLEFAAAAERIHAANPEVAFLLVGPDDTGSLDRLSGDELSYVREALTWDGARPDVATILALSDIFVCPTRYSEGIPRVLLEAASMGLAIVATDRPGCRAVVEDGVNGLLVPVQDPEALSDAIDLLIKQPGLRRRFGRASRRRVVERFDLSIVAEQTCLTYQQLLANKSQSVAIAP